MDPPADWLRGNHERLWRARAHRASRANYRAIALWPDRKVAIDVDVRPAGTPAKILCTGPGWAAEYGIAAGYIKGRLVGSLVRYPIQRVQSGDPPGELLFGFVARRYIARHMGDPDRDDWQWQKLRLQREHTDHGATDKASDEHDRSDPDDLQG